MQQRAPDTEAVSEEQIIEDVLSFGHRQPQSSADIEQHLEGVAHLVETFGRTEGYLFAQLGLVAATVDDLFHNRGYVTDQYRSPADWWTARTPKYSMRKVNAAKELYYARLVLENLGLDYAEVAGQCNIERARAVVSICRPAAKDTTLLEDAGVRNSLREEVITTLTLSSTDMRTRQREQKGQKLPVPLILDGSIVNNGRTFRTHGPVELTAEQVEAQCQGRLYLLPRLNNIHGVWNDVLDRLAGTPAKTPEKKTRHLAVLPTVASDELDLDILDQLEHLAGPLPTVAEPAAVPPIVQAVHLDHTPTTDVPLPEIFAPVGMTYPDEGEQNGNTLQEKRDLAG